MPDVHVHFHFEEPGTMAKLNELLDRIARSEAKADAEAAEVKIAFGELKQSNQELRRIVEGLPLPEEDLSPAYAALDRLDSKIDAIHTPEPVEPPVEPQPPVE